MVRVSPSVEMNHVAIDLDPVLKYNAYLSA